MLSRGRCAVPGARSDSPQVGFPVPAKCSCRGAGARVCTHAYNFSFSFPTPHHPPRPCRPRSPRTRFCRPGGKQQKGQSIKQNVARRAALSSFSSHVLCTACSRAWPLHWRTHMTQSRPSHARPLTASESRLWSTYMGTTVSPRRREPPSGFWEGWTWEAVPAG